MRKSSLLFWSGTVIAATVACGSPNTAPPGERVSTPRPAGTIAAPPLEVLAADLPPLPPGLATAARPVGTVKLAYEFAARHPEVLHYVPCFCGCERSGHQGNLDCFVAGRNAQGQVTEWTNHGMNCEICIDVADLARQMHNAGASVRAIRNEIERRFASPNLGHTPTPMPPDPGSAGD
jgi:hypothetical protein